MEKEGVHLCQGSGRAGDDAVALQETSSVVPVALAYWGHPVVDTRHRTHGRVTRWQGRVDGDEVPACLFVEPFAHPRERAHTCSLIHPHAHQFPLSLSAHTARPFLADCKGTTGAEPPFGWWFSKSCFVSHCFLVNG